MIPSWNPESCLLGSHKSRVRPPPHRGTPSWGFGWLGSVGRAVLPPISVPASRSSTRSRRLEHPASNPRTLFGIHMHVCEHKNDVVTDRTYFHETFVTVGVIMIVLQPSNPSRSHDDIEVTLLRRHESHVTTYSRCTACRTVTGDDANSLTVVCPAESFHLSPSR